ncbi:hypothetical protein NDN08_007091 [Rhodosorus marinus]|uniref:Cupin type-1 domain-containing protein n=1 Tax=Rhodosorus marinus TaxID=101924 RepID=A0AAV8UJ01_9RHOD|nr:hypothetical protein NDN08_007091 [Rhodosorus marinus]
MKAGAFGVFFLLAGCLYMVSAMEGETTLAERNRRFGSASDFVFNLKGVSADFTRAGARIQGGDVSKFPALDNLGVSNTLFTIKPCGMNLPHYHPRATELIYVIKGQDLTVAFAEENSGRSAVVNVVGEGDNAVFPQGLLHYQINLNCEHEVQFLSSLSSHDPGVVTVPDRMFGFDDTALAVVFNNPRMKRFRRQRLTNLRSLSHQCIADCRRKGYSIAA